MFDNSASVIKMARYLGKELQKSKPYLDYRYAVKAKQDDEALQNLICEYNLKKISVDMESKKENIDKNKLKRLNDELKICYNKIKDNSNMKNFEKKKATIEKLINDLNNTIINCVE